MVQGHQLAAARIYKPAKTAMQSGRAKTKKWVLDFEPASARKIEPLMGWTSSSDMTSQVKLFFETREEAIAYAERNAIPFEVFEPHDSSPKRISYSDNFRTDRLVPWTH